MKTKILSIAILAIMSMVAFSGCNSNKRNSQVNDSPAAEVTDAHNSRNSLDYEGTYAGIMPCADCSGIYTEVTLSGNGYKLTQVYQGIDEPNSFEKSGTYTWDNNGSIIILGGDSTEQYQVGENTLFALDQNGKRITGDLADSYILKKK